MQQSLQHWHFAHKWFSQASFVQATQMSRDGWLQMLQTNVMVSVTFVSFELQASVAAVAIRESPCARVLPGNAALPN
jgi:hypothetical protein